MIHMIARNAWGHSGHEFRPAKADGTPWFDGFTTTSHHDLHHTDVKGNYGLYFTFWDRFMGTEHPDYHDRFRINVGAVGAERPDQPTPVG
jgi:sterol desaturase/sphingolipid hydroxylase (fatty acid hydroxylase superfamily)